MEEVVIMYIDYCFYLNKLIGTQKKKEVLIFMLFWLLMFAVARVLQAIYIKKHKDVNDREER